MFTWFTKKTKNESVKLNYYFDEIQLHENSGLKYNTDFRLEDYEVNYVDQSYKIHAFVGGDKSKPLAFMFHGYAASEAQFFKMYKKLLRAFHVISIDLPGMGLSSKENINISNKEQAMDFLSGTIIALMQQFPGKKTLIGHSFGGYVAGLVAKRCPEQIERIYFLSPAGATQYNQEEIEEIQNFQNEMWFKRKFAQILQIWWKSQETLNECYKRWWSPFFIKQFLRFRVNLKGQELHLYEKYLFNYLQQPVGSEKSIFMMFFLSKVRLSTDYSIEQMIRNSKELQQIPIMFYYGDTDWMDQIGPQRLVKEYKNIKLRIVKNTDHQLVFFNPEDTVSYIIEDLIV